jgi:hypothetical protein
MAVALQASDGSGGPVTFRDIDGSANTFVYTLVRLVFSGSYVTGGDTVDLTPLVQAGVPSQPVAPLSAWVEGNGTGTSQQAAGGYYAFLTGTALNNNKVKIFNAAGGELAAGAYPAAVTSDVVTVECYWRKFQ